MLLNLIGFHAGRGGLKITHATALILLVPLGKSRRGSGEKSFPAVAAEEKPGEVIYGSNNEGAS